MKTNQGKKHKCGTIKPFNGYKSSVSVCNKCGWPVDQSHEERSNSIKWGLPYTTDYVVGLWARSLHKKPPKLFPPNL